MDPIRGAATRLYQPTLSTYTVPDHAAFVVTSTPNSNNGVAAFDGTVSVNVFQALVFSDPIACQLPVQVQPPAAPCNANG